MKRNAQISDQDIDELMLMLDHICRDWASDRDNLYHRRTSVSYCKIMPQSIQDAQDLLGRLGFEREEDDKTEWEKFSEELFEKEEEP